MCKIKWKMKIRAQSHIQILHKPQTKQKQQKKFIQNVYLGIRKLYNWMHYIIAFDRFYFFFYFYCLLTIPLCRSNVQSVQLSNKKVISLCTQICINASSNGPSCLLYYKLFFVSQFIVMRLVMCLLFGFLHAWLSFCWILFSIYYLDELIGYVFFYFLNFED